MQTILTVQSMRESDARAIAEGTPGRELMGRAAGAIFEAAEWIPPVAVVCGKGNNGGDGFALACLLNRARIDCTLLIQDEPVTPDAGFYYQECRRERIPILLYYLEGFDIGQIAAVLRIPRGTVKSRLHRGRDQLRTICREEVFE